MSIFEYMILTFVIIIAVILFLSAVDLLVRNHATPHCFGKRYDSGDVETYGCDRCEFIIPCDSAERKE